MLGLVSKKSFLSVSALFASKFSRRISLGIIFLLIIILGAVNDSVEQNSAMPLAMKLGGIIGDADRNVYMEIQEFKEIVDPSGWTTIWSLLKVLGYFYLLYLLYIIVFHCYNFFNDSLNARSFFFAIMTIFVFHIGWGIFLMYMNQTWNGIRGLTLQQVWFVVKPAGTIEFIKNVNIYVEPLSSMSDMWLSSKK